MQPSHTGGAGVMNGRTAGKPSSFYMGMALLGLAVAVGGFSKTFFAPIIAGTFDAPMVVHLHGAAAFSWVLLFFV